MRVNRRTARPGAASRSLVTYSRMCGPQEEEFMYGFRLIRSSRETAPTSSCICLQVVLDSPTRPRGARESPGQTSALVERLVVGRCSDRGPGDIREPSGTPQRALLHRARHPEIPLSPNATWGWGPRRTRQASCHPTPTLRARNSPGRVRWSLISSAWKPMA